MKKKNKNKNKNACEILKEGDEGYLETNVCLLLCMAVFYFLKKFLLNLFLNYINVLM